MVPDGIEKIRKLGEGGMSEVWLVYDQRRGATFALKHLREVLSRPKDVKRFEREIEALKSLEHPNIVKLIDAWSDIDGVGYLMEHCPAGSLEDNVPSNGMPEDEATAILLQVLEGLQFAHSFGNGVIHRDIKPGNILLGADGRFKLSDFGLSIWRDSEISRVTTSNWLTPFYSPPEQYDDFFGTDERGDLFAVGSTFHYLLTGQPYRRSAGLEFPDPVLRFLEVLTDENPANRPDNAADALRYWADLHSEEREVRFRTLREADKFTELADIADVHCGMDSDILRINEAAYMLDRIREIESDPAVIEEIERLRAHVHSEGIAMEEDISLHNAHHH